MNVTKGISPLIASVLLLAFTMSIAMIAGPYFTQTIQTTQEGQTDKAQTIRSSTKADFNFMETSYNSNNGNTSVTIQNTGTAPITNYTVTAITDNPVQIELEETLQAGEIKTVTLNTTNKPRELRVSAKNSPVAMNHQLNEQNLATGSAPDSPTGLTLSD